MPRRSRRGMVGIDTAIILIAFVLVAAAVAFVVLDMGMTSAQKAKQTMESGLQESSTALQVDGNVMAYVNSNGEVQDVFIPLGVTPGTGYVSFAPSLMEVSIITPSGSYANIYRGVSNLLEMNPSTPLYTIATDMQTAYTTSTAAVVYFIHGNITPYVLGPYGQALLVIYLPSGLPAYKSFTVTISPSIGGAITVARIIPPDNVTNTTIDLG
ncbi:Probable flagellin 1 precursor [Acidilobus saccharovorans 345-15]|uniref:Flagellin n=1 Tax=Acidilobus saccharovorans (strain DSM 16705 / JCM 18335 / VKM B-2471 / 345-15) TaxID=666510 RepID=D9PZ88_ACIS3|nr:archaellin/type IV pilin N-terminal domain-containing protein [Acidilobus saccharovorans]ADL19875.1 Probable flagellin 1 precursor [Acidilobus saccharovorans 345-15]